MATISGSRQVGWNRSYRWTDSDRCRTLLSAEADRQTVRKGDWAMIRLRDLRVDYENVTAVHDLSLEVGPGEVCGLIGPNGAGKTTTMRAMIGLIEPTHGIIEMAGVDIREHPERASRLIGFMPDFPPMYDDLKCWEFLDLFGGSNMIPRRERGILVDQYLELVGLTEKRNAMVLELSRGMRQRLMLAKTLIPQPKVILLDEPASGMDPTGRIELRNILRELAAVGRTVLVSSHILTEMSEFCTFVAIMERGRMVVSGRIDEVNAQIMGGSPLVIEILDGVEKFLNIAAEDPLAGTVEKNDGDTFMLRYSGDTPAASNFLAQLISSGVRVASFSRRKEGLEELFLKVGAKELS